MDQNKALNSLLECADLISMLEDLSNISAKGAFSPTTIAGLRITLRNIREQILAGHDALAQILITGKGLEQRPAAQQNNVGISTQPREPMIVGGGIRAQGISQETPVIQRRDLRSTLEKVIENS